MKRLIYWLKWSRCYWFGHDPVVLRVTTYGVGNFLGFYGSAASGTAPCRRCGQLCDMTVVASYEPELPVSQAVKEHS